MSTVDRPRTTNGPTSAVPSYDSRADYDYDYEAEKGSGWLVFAALMLGLAGTIGVIAGIVAVADSTYYVNGARYVFSDLHTWGWIVMLVGVVAIFAAFGVVKGSQWARWFGIVVAGLQALAQLLFIQAYPWWSLCVFAIDLMVIYGLAVYGGSRGRTRA